MDHLVSTIHINTIFLINEATAAAVRVNYVRQDPAVIKAAKTAGRDIAQAARPTATLVQEASESWISSGHAQQRYSGRPHADGESLTRVAPDQCTPPLWSVAAP